MGVNSLPKTVTRQRRDCDLNPGPSAPESGTLTRTTRLPSHPELWIKMYILTMSDVASWADPAQSTVALARHRVTRRAVLTVTLQRAIRSVSTRGATCIHHTGLSARRVGGRQNTLHHRIDDFFHHLMLLALLCIIYTVGQKTDMQNGHNHFRGSGKYGRWAACGCGISPIPLRLDASILINCWKIDAELLAKCVI